MKKFFIVSFFFLLILNGCNQKEDFLSDEKEKFQIVTTIAPLYSFVTNITEGTDVIVSNLLPPGSSEHVFQLKPSDATLLQKADIIVINGLGLETYLSDALSISKDALLVDSSVLITPLRSLDEEEGSYDPHVWLDPDNAVSQIITIKNALIQKDPSNASLYEKNVISLIERIRSLQTEIADRIARISIQPYIVFHDAYQYFERAFSIHSIAALEPFPGKEPSPQYLQKIINLIEKNNVKAIFSEPQFLPKLVETLAKDYDLKSGELDPVGTQITQDGYFVMMRKNVEVFEKVFSEIP